MNTLTFVHRESTNYVTLVTASPTSVVHLGEFRWECRNRNAEHRASGALKSDRPDWRSQVDGIHDCGGMTGYGPVPYQKTEPFFHHEWEGRTLSILTWMHLKGISWWDKSRFYREMMGNENYVNELRDSYYTHWLSAAERILVSDRYFTEEERKHRVEEILDGRYVDRPPYQEFDEAQIQEAIDRMHTPHSLKREGPEPGFTIGDEVLVKNMNPLGHSRCPKFVRARTGKISNYHGCQLYPETTYLELAGDARPLYTVEFTSRELWGEDGNDRDTVYVDLWEPYLVAA
ncbi:nitrile hydratase subunit beta [Gordonia hydrophobica]|uniref:nitrile hydratase n=1 Tax=Gordonia hydrophobica TaxID=40516 RepID=A0ABZ2U4X0_9ACTN|nr:nitrile hydratase subunit beta [Gordonia hydrophobica]